MKEPKQIVVDAPVSDARRDRVEREVFARLDAMRDVDHANQIAPVLPKRTPMIAATAFAFVAAASVVFLVSRETPPARPSTPSSVVTPSDSTSTFTVGDAVIEAGKDTSVEVKQDPNGTTTLTLVRGSVDCDVMPRSNRAPFRVVAGDVTVEVVGTRFDVSRIGTITRVDVTRGKVKVHGKGELRYVGAGESWTSEHVGSAISAVTPAPVVEEQPPIVAPEPAIARGSHEDEIELPAESMRPTRPAQISPQQAYEAALEIKDERRRAKAYRAVANGNHTWAALSLFNLAELQAKTDVDATLATLDELKRRFPAAANSQDAAWFRVDVLRDARRTEESKQAAREYLRDFPRGTYAKLAARLVRPSSP
jgi:FecR protein